MNTKHAFQIITREFSKRSSDSFNLFSSASTVSKNMVFSDFKESIKTCDSDNYKNKLFFLLNLLEFSIGFLKEFTYQKGIFREIIKIIFRELRKIYVEEVMDHTQEINLNTSVTCSDTN